MSALQEVLTVLLGAESEAGRIVEDAKSQSTSVMRLTQDSFDSNRKIRMAAAREQAKSVMANALAAAQTEAKQILDLGREERDRVNKRFQENADRVVANVLTETVDKILARGE